MPRDCTICGDDVDTRSDNALCSRECLRDWLQQEFNEMDEDHAYCPVCGQDGFDCVRTALHHHNQKHQLTIRRTKTCLRCGVEFEPKCWNQPNKFSGRDCFENFERAIHGHAPETPTI